MRSIRKKAKLEGENIASLREQWAGGGMDKCQVADGYMVECT